MILECIHFRIKQDWQCYEYEIKMAVINRIEKLL